MGIVGVNSTAGRAVKCIDPSKTTKSESSWLGYTLCDCTLYIYVHCITHIHYIHTTHSYVCLCRAHVLIIIRTLHTHALHIHTSTLVRARVTLLLLRTHIYQGTLTLYNEERRLGDQRGSDTLVVPFFTSNDGLSIAYLFKYIELHPQPAK